MSQLDVDELDLPPGLNKSLESQKLGESSVRNIENVNKDKYISKWLQNSSSDGGSESNCPTLAAKKVYREMPVSQTPSSSSSSALSSNRRSLKSAHRKSDPPTKVEIYPAGYNPIPKSNSSKSNSLKRKSLSRTSPIAEQTHETKVIESSIDEQIKPDLIVQAMKSRPSPEMSSDWKEVFEKQKEFERQGAGSGSHSSNNEKMKKHIKRSLGLCNCADCEGEIPNELIYAEKENFQKREAPERKRPPPLIKSEEDNLIATVMTAPVVRSQQLADNKMAVLTHGHTVPQPQDEINKTNLIPIVQEQLKFAGYERSKPVQSFGWPAIMRGNNVVMIHQKQTGKTLTYIPALCSFLMDQEGRYERIPDSKRSPLLIVLTNNATVAEEVYSKFAHMLKGNKLLANMWSPLLPLSKKEISQFFGRKPNKFNKNGKNSKKTDDNPKLDVVITTVDTLIVLLNDNIIDLKRLRHMVVENLNIILEKLQKRFQLVLGAVDSMLSHRNCYDGVQFICTGEKWTKKLESFVTKLDNFPLIIIGNPMQAALYGRAQFKLQCVQKKIKAEKLTELLKTSNYNIHKCIVVCKLDEVQTLEKQFALRGITFVTTTDEMSGGQVVDLLMSWKTSPSGKHIVLICTDKSLRHYVKVANASFLVNYSLPPTWSLFSQRFSTLIDSYQCPLTSTFNQNKFNCHIVTYVDEKCMDRFPRLSNFFTLNNIKIPDALLQFCKEEKMKAEQEKIISKMKLCKSLLTLGICDNPDCKDRHLFSSDLETATNTPENGHITCRLINMRAINHYYLQILEYKDLEGEIHKISDYSAKVSVLLKESNVFEISPDAIKDKMYLCAADKEFYRCVIKRIVKYASIGDTMTANPLEVEIFGLENGIKTIVNVNKLYNIPKSLEEIPPSVVEVYIARLIPPFKESLWTRNANRALLTKLKTFNKKAICVGNILLRLNDTIWVDDLQLREVDIPFPNRMSITQFLQNRNIYDKAETLESLYALCQDGGVELPEYKMFEEEVSQQPKLMQADATWAHLRTDELNAVYFSAATDSHCVYVRHAKFDSLLKKLEENIASSVHLLRRKLDKDEIIEGCYYCMADEASGNWCRVLLVAVEGNLAKCFSVDYGDYVSVPVGDLRLLSDDYFTRLPFQAIECDLYGVKQSSAPELIDALYEQSFEPNTDYFKTLYAMYMTIKKSETLAVSGRMKYKVMLLDYYTGEVDSVNNVLIKLKLAEQIAAEPVGSVRLPESKAIPDVSNLNDEEDEFDSLNEDSENCPLNAADFDFFTPSFNTNDKIMAELSETKQENVGGYVPMKAIEKTNDTLLPNIRWYQDEKQVFLEIIFTENDDYKLRVARSRFLSFSSIYKNKHYELIMNLYSTVRKQFVHESKTHFISVVLTKEKEVEWPRLVKSEDKMTNIKYKLDRIEIEADVEENEEDNLLQSDDIDAKYFQGGVVITADGEIEEIPSDIDSDSDYEAILED